MDSSSNIKKSRQTGLFITLGIVMLALIALAVIGFITVKPQPDTIQGQADATEIRISGKLPGRVVEIYVEEGQEVHAGDTLVHIHSSLMDARMAQAQSLERVAQAGERKVDAGTRTQIVQGAEDLYNQALAARGIAEKTWQRMENLYQKGVISAQKRDEAKAAYDAAVAGASAAKSQWDLAKAGAQSEDKQAAAAMVGVARGGVKEAGAMLEDSYLVAPCDGIITVIYPHESELVMTGAPVMTLQKADTYAVFNVRETLLGDMRVGRKIKVNIPALKKDAEMTVYYVKDMGAYANWQATKSTGSFDARTFEVKARPEKPIEGLIPGMSIVYLETLKK